MRVCCCRIRLSWSPHWSTSSFSTRRKMRALLDFLNLPIVKVYVFLVSRMFPLIYCTLFWVYLCFNWVAQEKQQICLDRGVQKSILGIKLRLASRPILQPPNYDLPILMAVDVSDVAIGACLLQIVDGLQHPTCYLNKKLNKHQCNYSTVEKEAFGLLFATRAFSVYFGSSPCVYGLFTVTVFTTHV